MIKSAFTMTALLLASTTASAFFCPSNFQDIQMGDSLQTVLQKCGPPTRQSDVTPEDTGPEEWIYNIGVTGQGSLRMSFMLQDNKILNILSNSMSLPTTDICGHPISVGNTADQLKVACGEPAFVNKSATAQKATPLTELFYDGRPPQTLIFNQGILKDKKMGTSGPPQFTTTP